jgi:hypothetical protein
MGQQPFLVRVSGIAPFFEAKHVACSSYVRSPGGCLLRKMAASATLVAAIVVVVVVGILKNCYYLDLCILRCLS